MGKAENNSFYKTLLQLAVPITLQSLVMSLLFMTDQVMVGQLGDTAIATVGIASKINSVVSVVLAGLAGALSIYVAQYWGSKDRKSISQLLGLGLAVGLALSLVFAAIIIAKPDLLLSLFTKDSSILSDGRIYLQIIAISFVPAMLTMLYSAMLRSTGHVKFPMYISLFTVILNIVLNYLLIFGHLGLPKLGLAGSAYATLISRVVESMLIIGSVYKYRLPGGTSLKDLFSISRPLANKFLITMYPLVLTELVWVLSEAVYAIIYSRMGTVEMTAMTITFPLQGLMIGLLTGISGAAAVMVGNKLGAGEPVIAQQYAKRLIRFGIAAAFVLGVVIALIAPLYTKLFQVSAEADQLSVYILWVFAAFIWVKVANMIMAGGVLQSGGDSKFVFAMESTATWLVGVPLGLLLSVVWKQPIFWVYFFLSLEELVRFVIGWQRLRSGKWVRNLTTSEESISA
ncbi:MATE family efflux transporter [Paenibacillus alkaliterrae]|uniref:MATE family efflux transporter n=1 Tax=Paenibacillus alkaliterrae TaxID=320909 RepID=UPI001F1F1547|nr:MATE family efflux transporter [Paenibacillus alkaliterrae]MCF2941226.1 MATE family efflux transporter [Paenibacillus alkaliterrae]